MALAEINLRVTVTMKPEGFRYRTNWRGKLILQKSYEIPFWDGYGESGYSETCWRDATASDINLLITTEVMV